MIANKTYNNVLNTLLRIGQHHYQIQTMSVGDIWKIDLEKETKFPLMHINPVNVTTGQSQLNYNFQIFIMDMVGEDKDWGFREQPEQSSLLMNSNFSKLHYDLTNSQEVYNSTLNIAIDVISLFRSPGLQTSPADDAPDLDPDQGTGGGFEYFTEGEFALEPFEERFDNLCCGWVFNLVVVVENDFQVCNIPYDYLKYGK